MDEPQRIAPGSFEDLIWLTRDEAIELCDVLGHAAVAAEAAGDVPLWLSLTGQEALLTERLLGGR